MPADLCHDRFAAVVDAHPHAPAVRDGQRTLTYAELDERSRRVAAWLASVGAGPDRVVAILVDRGVDLPACALAVWRVGAAYLALDPHTPRTRLRSVLAEVRPVAVLTQRRLRHRVAAHPVPALAVDADLPDRPAVDPVRLSADHLAYLIHTSGSTGAPKAVGVSHRALVAIADGWRRLYRLGTQARSVLQVAGFGFDVATGDLARGLFTGACLIACPRDTLLSPPDLYEFLNRERPDFAEFTPALLGPLVRYVQQIGGRLDAPRQLVAGGEQWSVADYRALRSVLGPAVRVYNTYGLTEAAIDSTWHEAGDGPYPDHGIPIGEAFPGTRLAVLDDELRPVDEGELYVAGPQLARGYLGDPATTAQRFVPVPYGEPGERWYRTGDVVRRLSTGQLLYLGRRDDQVKVRGVRMHLGEVEAGLAAHPAVRTAVVVAHRRDNGTELTGYLLADPDSGPVEVEHVHRFAAARLPSAMVPATLRFVDHLPVTANGKVDRSRLPGLARDDADPTAAPGGRDNGAAVTGSPAGQALVGILSRLLGRPVTGADQDFFELGGDSLLAAKLVATVRAELGVELPSGAVYRHPTVAELARLVATAGAAEVIPADPSRVDGPLSPGQTRLWILHQLDGGLAGYNIPIVVKIAGPVRVPLLTEALNRLLARHAALRTAFLATPDGPRQRVVDGVPLNVETVAVGRDDLDDWVADFARRPFDLAAPPLLRAALLVTSDRQYRLVLVMHHLVSDGWTVRVLMGELGLLYSALVDGRPADLPEQRLSYLDYAVWYDERLRRGDFADQLAYWRRELDGASAQAPLPAVAPPGQAPGVARALLGTDLSYAIRDLAAEQRSTVFVVLLAGFAALLRRWSTQDDLVVGVPFGDRGMSGTAGLCGFFVTTAALRLPTSPGDSFADLVRLTRGRVAAAAGNQDVPFDVVQQALRRSGASVPFRTWFNFLGPPDPAPELAGLVTEIVDPPPVGALFDLNLYVTDLADDLRLELVYDSAHTDAAHMAAFLQQYTALLAEVATDPDAPVGAHRLPGAPVGAHRLPGAPLGAGCLPGAPVGAGCLSGAPVPGQPGTGQPLPSLSDSVAARIAERPDAIAIRHPHGQLSYAELGRWVTAVADRLAGAGVGRGDVVAVYAPRGATLVAALLGTLAVDAAFCVLDPAYPAARLATQLDLVPPAALLYAERTPPPPDLARRIPALVDLADRPPPTPAPTAPPAPAGDGLAGVAAAGDGLAYVAFTSGTTGMPKVVRGTGTPVAHFLARYAERFALGPRDRFAMLSGLAHDPLLRDVFAPLTLGATLCVPPADHLRSPRDLRAWLAAERVTVAHLTPPLLRLLAAAPGATLSDLRLMLSGGDMMYAADVTRARGLAPHATVVNGYGCTETPQLAAWHEVPPSQPVGPADRRVPIGVAVDGVELLVRTAHGQPAATGEVGRVVVGGRYLSQGLGAEYDTGDLGRPLADGTVELLGRADDQVSISGYRAEPAEVDAVARTLPYLRDCATVARPGPGGELCLVSYVVPAPSEPADLDRLRRDLRGRLPAHLVPAGLVPVDRLPLTANGKLDRSALPPWTPAATPATGVPPQTRLEKVIAGTWRRVLDTGPVSVDTSFFDLGGSSVLLARVQQALEAEIARPVSMLTLLEYPTVRALAAHLAGHPTAGRTGPETDVPAGRPRQIPVSPDARQRLAVRRAIRREDMA